MVLDRSNHYLWATIRELDSGVSGVRMGFSPSVEIHDRMVSELAGAYFDRAFNPPPDLWLVAKLPMNLIREIQVGAELSLVVWMVQVEDHMVLTFGLRVYDDIAAPFTTFGSCRSDAEVSDLLAVLACGAFPLQLHNENFLPLFAAECRFDSGQSKAVTIGNRSVAIE